MNVRGQTAIELLKRFSQLENALKRVPRFIQGDPGRSAQVEWSQVSLALSQLPAADFAEQLPHHIREKLLRSGNRPMKEIVRLDLNGSKYVRFEVVDLPRHHEAASLLEAAKRVRNNLFHGGKENPLQENRPGDDQEWAEAALIVAEKLLELTAKGALH